MLCVGLTRKGHGVVKEISGIVCRHVYKHAAEESLPKIRVPQKMVHKINKLLKKQAIEAASLPKKRHSGAVVLSCKRKDFNHHMGQEYSDFMPHMLASHGWKHKKSPGDHFSINKFAGIPAFRNSDEHSFDDLQVRPEVLRSIEDMGLKHPTNIQTEAIPSLRSGNNTIVAAETGSGKTLAYLIPIVESLLHHRETYGVENIVRCPQAVILAPSRELSNQIAGVAEVICRPLGMNVVSLKGGRGLSGQCKEQQVEILVATPGVLRKALMNEHYTISRAQHLVIDECDTLMDDSFNGLVKYIMRKMQIQSSKRKSDIGDGAQLIMVGATMPKDLQNILRGLIPMDSMDRVTTPYLHRVMPHVVQKFHRLTSILRPVEMIKLAKSSSRGKIPTMVFCNQTTTSAWLCRFLQENGVNSFLMQGSLREETRRHIFEQFKNAETDILVSTDIASRGLDTIHVQRVINYDFPLFMSDYIHRVGRVGRVGSKIAGNVFNFIVHKWDVDLVWKIETAIRKMTELNDVNANIKRNLASLSEAKETKGGYEGDPDNS